MRRAVAAVVGSLFLAAGACAETISPEAAAGRLSRAIREGEAAWRDVRDYEARFVKQETAEGKTGPEETIFLKYEKPFKIFLGWLDTHKKGLQVFYERGKHDGKLAIHKPGLFLGLAPVIFLDQNSPWVREGSASFDIEDAGIGTFLESLAEDAEAAAKQNRLRVRILNDDAAGMTAEVEFADSTQAEDFMARRVEVFFDAVSKLPTRMTLFDEAGLLIGRYAYEDLALNVPDEQSFKSHAHRALFKLFTAGERRAKESSAVSAPAVPVESGRRALTVQAGGKTRKYLLFVPSAADAGRPLPLVLAFHGAWSDSRWMAETARWEKKAEAETFLVAFPETYGWLWNDGSRRGDAYEEGVDDAVFAETLVRDIAARVPVDPARVYATGFSNGGGMAFRLGIERSEIFSAVAAVAEPNWTDPQFMKKPVPLLHIVGTRDELNPLNGGEAAGLLRPPAGESGARWAKQLDLATDAPLIEDQSWGTRTRYAAPDADLEVVFCLLKDVKHVWPRSSAEKPDAFDATDAIWAFFKRHSRSPAQ